MKNETCCFLAFGLGSGDWDWGDLFAAGGAAEW